MAQTIGISLTWYISSDMRVKTKFIRVHFIRHYLPHTSVQD